MKIKTFVAPILVLALGAMHALAQSTAFDYQGRLTDNGIPATGLYDFQFTLFAVSSGGSPIGSPNVTAPVPVTNGLFNVTLNFGSGTFAGADRWLEIAVRANGNTAPRVILTPRQRLLPAPYAIHAGSASSLLGTVPDSQLSANIPRLNSNPTFTGTPTFSPPGGPPFAVNSAIKVGNLNADLLDGLDSSAFWKLTGNSGTTLGTHFLGTTDNRPLEVRASGVGIGTADIGNYRLRVDGPARLGGAMTIGRSGSAHDEIGFNIRFTGINESYTYLENNNAASIRFGPLLGGGMEFRTAPVGTSGSPLSLTTRMALTQSGRLGIGTTAPESALDVTGALTVRNPAASPNGAEIIIRHPNGNATLSLIAAEGGTEGSVITLLNESGTRSIKIDGDDSAGEGAITLYASGSAVPAITLDANSSVGAEFSLRTPGGTKTVEIAPAEAPGHGAFINLFNGNGARTVKIDGHDTGGRGVISLHKTSGTATIVLDADNGGKGQITTQVLQITGGSDLSERFDVTAPLGALEPGMVVCIDPANPGKLILSSTRHDRSVAGVLSGAGGVKPGMLMGQAGSKADGQHPVALTGRVYVWADASSAPIRPGDLLTTSDTPGHAMRVTDHAQAQGAIIGKAMTGLERGKELVLVLVSLQ